MSGARLAVAELGYDQKTFWRSPISVFATVSLPLLYLFIFVTNFGNQMMSVAGQPGTMKASTCLLAMIVAIGVVSAAFYDLTVALVRERERGILRRLRSTPVPTWVFIAGRVGNELTLAVLLAVVLTGLGALAYGVPIPAARLRALILTLIIAAAALCCGAFAFTTLIRKEDSAVAVAMGVMLTLFFISGNFFKVDNSAMRQIAGVFPVKHLYNAFLTAFNPHTAGSGILWPDLLVITLWGLGSLAAAVGLFRWTPSSG
jgi:ABC-2 type transport system permease protein